MPRVDEACAQLSVQLESRPEVIDQLERRKMQLEIEQKALEKESDKLSKQRLKNVKEEIKALSTQLAPLVEEYVWGVSYSPIRSYRYTVTM
jgi:ATP-dependent Clp protease ATP-binding subunit ClpB